MSLKETLLQIHQGIEAKELQKISKKEIATRLNIATITYVEWLRGKNEPSAMSAMLKMLSMLDDERMLMVISSWRYNKKFFKLSDIVYKIHKQIEDKELRNISQKEMAQRIGVAHSTYTAWLGEVQKPIAIPALLDLLAMLKGEDTTRIVRTWQILRDQ
ncbi:hypothetical protein ACHJH3_10255 [Campylobacter sp. MOP7]|uniref:hypothetical protein n=1 Tax=Campylobacter canis TaxID=3378588 RepID=UPI00387ED679